MLSHFNFVKCILAPFFGFMDFFILSLIIFKNLLRHIYRRVPFPFMANEILYPVTPLIILQKDTLANIPLVVERLTLVLSNFCLKPSSHKQKGPTIWNGKCCDIHYLLLNVAYNYIAYPFQD